MFESGSRGNYSFRSASSKTRDTASVGHSLTRSSVGHSVAGSIVAGDDVELKVVLKRRTTASGALPGQAPSEEVASAGEPVQNGRSSSIALPSKGVSHRSGTDNTKQSAERNETERSNGSPLVRTKTEDSVSETEQAEPQCNSHHDTTTEGCTKSLPNATNGQQVQQENTPNNTKRSAPSDPDSTSSSGHWSADDWSLSEGGEQNVSEADRHSRESYEDNDATEINNNNNNALKDNTVASSSSPDGQSVASGQSDDDHLPSIDGVALAAAADNDKDDGGGGDDDVFPLRGQDSELTAHQSTDQIAQHSSGLANNHSDDHSADQSPDNSDDHLHDQSANQLDDDSADHSDDQSADHSANHVDDHSSDLIDDLSANFSNGQIEKKLSQQQIDSGATCETETSTRGPTIIRTFEPPSEDATAAEPEHPYFARIAAEAAEPTPILSSRGTVRGVKNRVRSGIASFLDKQDGKKTVNYARLEKGRIVFYTTSVTVVRGTFEKCVQVKRILQTQMVEFEERDVFVSKALHQELIERLQQQPGVASEPPHVFVDGYHLGGAEEIERLNESGILRKIFNNFKKVQQPKCCTRCGGYRYIPCTLCHGSKKTRRNCFTNEFSALRCTSCDDNGLVKCEQCNVTGDDDQLVMASTGF